MLRGQANSDGFSSLTRVRSPSSDMARTPSGLRRSMARTVAASAFPQPRPIVILAAMACEMQAPTSDPVTLPSCTSS